MSDRELLIKDILQKGNDNEKKQYSCMYKYTSFDRTGSVCEISDHKSNAYMNTKPVIKQVFHITYIQNKGAAWGSLQESVIFCCNNHSCSGISCIFLCSDVKAE